VIGTYSVEKLASKISSHPGRVWNRIPDKVRQAMLDMALVRPELSPRELAVTFTDECG
tara:strand:- start:918 stop:1091 length:174 start_codon:yes stop_codon:yes gene_type:complete